MQKTKPKKQNKIDSIERSWHLFDVSGKILGRISSEIAVTLRGKSKPNFVPYLDCGDFVVIINAKDVKVTGGKEEKKLYTRYSGYPGGLRTELYKDLMHNHPERIIKNAILGMLPDNKLKDKLIKRLYIYKDANYPYKDKFNNK